MFIAVLILHLFYQVNTLFINIVILESGVIYSFGSNSYYVLGIGNEKNQALPNEIISLKNIPISKIYCGNYHIFAVSSII